MNTFIKTSISLESQGIEPVLALLQNREIFETSIEDPKDVQLIMENKDSLAWDFLDEELLEDMDKEAIMSFFLVDEPESYELIKLIENDINLLQSELNEGLYGDGIGFGSLKISSEVISNDWRDKYKEYFHKFEICDGITIRPPWEESENPSGIEIVIDPGMAFGTGTHETTSMCIDELKHFIKKGDKILDIGTGSGILAIAASMIGAEAVTAVEIDADAVESAKNNIAQNRCQNNINLIHGNILDDGVICEEFKYEIVIANLTSGILCLLMPKMLEYISKEGHLILSGILDVEEDKMRNALENTGFLVESIEKKGEWLRITATPSKEKK